MGLEGLVLVNDLLKVVLGVSAYPSLKHLISMNLHSECILLVYLLFLLCNL